MDNRENCWLTLAVLFVLYSNIEGSNFPEKRWLASTLVESFPSGRREGSTACLERVTRNPFEMASLRLSATDEYRKIIEEMESDEEFWELEELEKELTKIMEDCEGEKFDTVDRQQQQPGRTCNVNVTIGEHALVAPASRSVPVDNKFWNFVFQQQFLSARHGKVDRVRFLVLLGQQLGSACERNYSTTSVPLRVIISQRLEFSMKSISKLQSPFSAFFLRLLCQNFLKKTPNR